MTKTRYKFAPEDVGKTLDELAYSQINCQARFIFDHPIEIAAKTVIEFDSTTGTFALIVNENHHWHISGKWDR
jgi:hypothetical protein